MHKKFGSSFIKYFFSISWNVEFIHSSVPIQETTSSTTLVLVCFNIFTAMWCGIFSRVCPSTASKRSPHLKYIIHKHYSSCIPNKNLNVEISYNDILFKWNLQISRPSYHVSSDKPCHVMLNGTDWKCNIIFTQKYALYYHHVPTNAIYQFAYWHDCLYWIFINRVSNSCIFESDEYQ